MGLDTPELKGKDIAVVITISRTRPERGSTCQRCRIIRSFVAFTIMLGIFSLVIKDSANFLKMVTPERAAAAIWIAGSILFLFKLFAWLRERYAGVNADHAPSEQPVADKEKTVHRYDQ